MGIVSRTFSGQNLLHRLGHESPPQAVLLRGWRKKYRLSLFFATTAVIVIAAAAILVNIIVGGLAEDNLIRIAEENTARDGLHIQSMMRMGQSMGGGSSAGTVQSGEVMKDMGQPIALGMPSGPATDATKPMQQMQAAMSRGMNPSEPAGSSDKMQDMQMPGQLTLEFLAGPGGLPMTYPSLVEGLNIVQFDLLDLKGTVVWSTNPEAIGFFRLQTAEHQMAAAGEISSRLAEGFKVFDRFGGSYRADVVATTLPLRETPSGDIIGVMELYRGVAHDVAIQVSDAKSVVLWTTVGTMGGLFLFLLGFIVIADVNISRSNRREVLVVEEANQSLEARVRERTRELQEAQEQLVRSEKLAAIGQIAGGIAHDLRNPLGAINNAIYYLKRRLGASEFAKANPRIGQFLQIAEEEVQHSNAIISDLMSFARVGVPSLSPTNLGEAVGNALSTMEIRGNIHIVKQLASDLPAVMADEEQFYRVLINLANNAQDAMPDGGELTISTLKVDEHAEIAFGDTGVGISADDMRKIFEPLFTTKTKGTGLGLAVSQQIVAKHGGSILATSSPGEGTTFTVRVPLDCDEL